MRVLERFLVVGVTWGRGIVISCIGVYFLFRLMGRRGFMFYWVFFVFDVSGC